MEVGSSKAATKADGSTAVSPMLLSQQARRKASGTTAWLVVSESGESHLEEFGKHSIMRRTGLRTRDLRILDPTLSNPSTLLGRYQAIVVNLEHLKAIVTVTEVFVLSSNHPQVTSFVENLQYHLSNHHRSTPRQAAESSDIDAGVTNKGLWGSPSFPSHSPDESESPSPMQEMSGESSAMTPEMKDHSPDSPLVVSKDTAGTKVLPFEFRVLEVCLRCTCQCLEHEDYLNVVCTQASQLEKEAYPALDELTSKISTLNLERVRQIKIRLATISVRVQKLRDELEHLLDDDMDMAEMYLTDKIVQQELEETSSVSELDDDSLDVEDERQVETSFMPSVRGEDTKSRAKSIWESFGGSKPNIVELEMLLEAYFTQMEGTLSKLSTLKEYVDDTEDYINIMLDDKQNQMLEMGVMLTTANMILTAGVVVAGVLSMNIHIKLWNPGPESHFIEAAFGLSGGCLILYIMAIGYFKRVGLLA
ncbi:hypothetical protein ACLOJK_033146 [Asimina triloba]